MSRIPLIQLIEEKLPDDGKPWIINDSIMFSLYSIFNLVDRNKITNDITNLKQKCLRITKFDIKKDQYHEVVLRVARECPNLEILKFSQPKNIYIGVNDLIISILKICPNIKFISNPYHGETNPLNDETVIEIVRLCPKIEKFVLRGVSLTDKSLLAIANGCPELKELYLTSITPLALSEISKKCKRLKILDYNIKVVY